MRFQLSTLAAIFAILARGPAIGAQNATSRNFRVTLLGTGSPVVSVARFGPSILVEAGDQTLVIDAGRGRRSSSTSSAFRLIASTRSS